MKITKSLVKHLVTLGLDAKHENDATFVEAEVKAFATEKILSGELTVEQVKSLTVDQEVTKAAGSLQATVAAAVSAALAGISEQQKSFAEALQKSVSEQMAMSRKALGLDAETETKGASLGAAIMAGAASGTDGAQTGGDGTIRLKAAVERYSDKRTALLYGKSINPLNRAKFGENSQVRFGMEQTPIDEPSQRDKAIAGAWMKFMMVRFCKSTGRQVPNGVKLSEHDMDLVNWAARNSEFIGPVGNKNADEESCLFNFDRTKADTDLKVKALLDDSTSGGLEAVPIEFDNMVIMSALLNGELFPLVDWKTVNRRRQEGYSMGEFTFTNTAEGTAITPFTTTSFIAAFDTTIYPIVGAVEVGLDFLDDAPTDIGGQIQTRYADGFLKHMDNQIAAGNGTTSLTGLFTTSGLNNIDASSGSLPYKTADVENLLFGVTKPYRAGAGRGAASRAVFLSNELVYKRMRQIPWSTETNLRAFGTQDYESYMLAGHPYKINEAVTSPNAKAGFFCMNWYRGYRRAGFQVTVDNTGATNRLKNQETIVVRARYGGQLALAAAGCIIDDLPTS